MQGPPSVCVSGMVISLCWVEWKWSLSWHVFLCLKGKDVSVAPLGQWAGSGREAAVSFFSCYQLRSELNQELQKVLWGSVAGQDKRSERLKTKCEIPRNSQAHWGGVGQRLSAVLDHGLSFLCLTGIFLFQLSLLISNHVLFWIRLLVKVVNRETQ